MHSFVAINIEIINTWFMFFFFVGYELVMIQSKSSSCQVGSVENKENKKTLIIKN